MLHQMDLVFALNYPVIAELCRLPDWMHLLSK